MDAPEIYYFDDGWLHGPAAITDIADMVAVGELEEDAPTWTQSGDDWIRAGFFARLARQDDNSTPQVYAPMPGAGNDDLPPPRQIFALRLACDQRLITRQQAERCLQEILSAPRRAYDVPGMLHRRGWITARQRSDLACLAQGDGKQKIIAGYEILEKLGSGGMGITYRARQISLDRVVALKVLLPRYCQDPEYVKRFVREAQVAAKLNHEYIATVYEVGSSNDECFMAMELVDGVPLAARVRELGRIPEAEAVEVVIKIASALDHAYGVGLIHRDISAKNIRIAKDGQPKLIDLGLAKNIDTFPGDESETAIGTPAYLSPEQALGRANVDIRSDIYSLGCVFYEMLTGAPPFQGESALETISMHLSRNIPEIRVPGVSPAVRAVVRKMTRRDLNERYQTPQELLADLRDLRPFAPEADAEAAAAPSVAAQLARWTGEGVEITLRADEREYLHLIAQEMGRRLEAEQVPPDFQGCAQTVFTELTANAFDHGVADDEDGRVCLRLELNPAFFRREVEDTGPGFAAREVLRALRAAPPDRERQRGLLQVKQIADLLEYNKKGNRVKAVLYRKAQGSGVYFEMREGVQFVEVRGKGDMALTEEFRRWVDNYAPCATVPVCLMVRTDWVCSMFVGAVAKLSGHMDEAGGRLAVWVERSSCRRIMEQLGVTSFVAIYASLDQAVGALNGKTMLDVE
ncbi:MAG: protein kinase [Planctomycetes bacterium]|nr:protein kinase [Planctomycetota bacterium]